MTRRPGDKTPEPPGGRAAERLRMFEDARRPKDISREQKKSKPLREEMGAEMMLLPLPPDCQPWQTSRRSPAAPVTTPALPSMISARSVTFGIRRREELPLVKPQ